MKQKKTNIYQVLSLMQTVFVICCFMPFYLFAQTASSIKNFNTTNGMPQNVVSGMAFDRTGYLWLATTYGLMRYDGFAFKTFLPDTTNSRTHVSNQVLVLSTAGPEKRIIIRTKNGLVYTIKDGRPVPYDSTISNITFTYGLRGHFPTVEIFKRFNLSYTQLTYKHEWDANAEEILPVNLTDFIVLSNNKLKLFYYKKGVKHSDIKLTKTFNFFLKSGKNNLLADIDYNLYLYDSAKVSFIKINTPLCSVAGVKGYSGKPVYFWDTYNDESYCYYNSIFYRLEVDAIAHSVKLTPCFSIEKQDRVWTGIIYDPLSSIYYIRTLSDGLFQVKLKQIHTFNFTNEPSLYGNTQDAVKYVVLTTSDSTALTATGIEFTSGIKKIISTKQTKIRSNKETINMLGDTGIICADKNQVYYYLRADDYKRRHVCNDSFNRHNKAYITFLQPEGDSLWVGTHTNIYCITRKQQTALLQNNVNGPSAFLGNCLFYRLSKDKTLISNNFGFYKLNTSLPYTIDSFPEMRGKQVRYISAYQNALLLSVYKHGLYVFRNDSFYKVPLSEDRLEISFCHSTYIDKTGSVWVTTNKGLFRSSMSSIMESVSKQGPPPFFIKYGETEGITNTEFSGGGTPSYAVLANGQVFYPSMGGIVTFNPASLSNTLSHSPIPVEKFETDNQMYLLTTDSIYLNADFTYLNITLSVPHFDEPENLFLEYNLDNTGWKKIQVFPSQSIVIYNLSSGYHKLVIRKRVGFSNTDYVYKTVTIFRRKYIYEQWWFYSALAIAVGLVIFLIVQIQTRNSVRKRIVLQKLVKEQTLELSKSVEAKELLINIISHDMVTPIRHINLIAGFLERGLEKEPKRIAEALLDIESTAGKILTGSFAIIDYMRYNSTKTVANKTNINIYTFVQEVCEIFIPIAKEKNIGLYNKVAQSRFVQIDVTIFGIILNNIVSNAIKYAGKGHVDIFIEPGIETKTVLKIQDTGMGMSRETLTVIQEVLKGNLQIIKTSNKASTGIGYMLISELAKIHALSVSVESEINKGTTVSIAIF